MGVASLSKCLLSFLIFGNKIIPVSVLSTYNVPIGVKLVDTLKFQIVRESFVEIKLFPGIHRHEVSEPLDSFCRIFRNLWTSYLVSSEIRKFTESLKEKVTFRDR